MPLTKEQHLDDTTTPKRILSLDGGGIRGILTLEYLEVIEGMLRQRTGRPDLCLADYFDLIGGTSTGAIIAATLACGMPVAKIKKVYRDLGASVFKTGFLQRFLLVRNSLVCSVRSSRDSGCRMRSTPSSAPTRHSTAQRYAPADDHDEAPRHRQSVAAAQPSPRAIRGARRQAVSHSVGAREHRCSNLLRAAGAFDLEPGWFGHQRRIRRWRA
jgi:hypothetical protein